MLFYLFSSFVIQNWVRLDYRKLEFLLIAIESPFFDFLIENKVQSNSFVQNKKLKQINYLKGNPLKHVIFLPKMLLKGISLKYVLQ